MTQRMKTPAPANDARGPALTGNKAAQAALERMVTPTLHKVSDLKTKRERLLYVADAIESAALVEEGIGFNMSDFYAPRDHVSRDMTGNRCKTIACIAGWTTLLEYGVEDAEAGGMNFADRAGEILMLSGDQRYSLFYGHGIRNGLETASTRQAVAVIRHLANKDEVRWDMFKKDGTLHRS